MDPETGTFLSVDPLVRSPAIGQTFNGYAYAENNPVSAVDPTGRSVEWRIVWSDPVTGDARVASHWQSAASVDAIVGRFVGADITVDGMDAGFASFVRNVSSRSASGRSLVGRSLPPVALTRLSDAAADPPGASGEAPGAGGSDGLLAGASGWPGEQALQLAGHGLLFSMRELPRLLTRLELGKAIATLPGKASGPIPRALFVVLGTAHTAYYMKMIMDNVVHQNALRPLFGLPTLDLQDAFVLGGYAGADLSVLHAEMDRVRVRASIPADAYR
jgi:hypothetical protein